MPCSESIEETGNETGLDLPRDSGRENISQTMTALLLLTKLLLNGQFQPGERMAEVPLAERLNVSRTPLRLALMSLEHDGLLEKHPTRGFVVRAFTLADIDDSIEMRGVIEGTAARFAAERLPLDAAAMEDALRELRLCTCQLDQVIGNSPKPAVRLFEQYIALNARFHTLLLELARSEVVSREMERVLNLPFASPNAFLLIQSEAPESREVLVIGQDQHRAMLEAIEQRQGARAEALAREHSRLTRRNLRIALSDRTLRHLVPGVSLIADVEQIQ